MPATPDGLKAPGATDREKQEGLTLLTGHFVGRADELGSLERLLDELGRGCPGAIEVAGEPGIGKTRLLREVAARAGARG
jgi:predicted ATP-dependent serine protease